PACAMDPDVPGVPAMPADADALVATLFGTIAVAEPLGQTGADPCHGAIVGIRGPRLAMSVTGTRVGLGTWGGPIAAATAGRGLEIATAPTKASAANAEALSRWRVDRYERRRLLRTVIGATGTPPQPQHRPIFM